MVPSGRAAAVTSISPPNPCVKAAFVYPTSFPEESLPTEIPFSRSSKVFVSGSRASLVAIASRRALSDITSFVSRLVTPSSAAAAMQITVRTSQAGIFFFILMHPHRFYSFRVSRLSVLCFLKSGAVKDIPALIDPHGAGAVLLQQGLSLFPVGQKQRGGQRVRNAGIGMPDCY